jgi:ribonuclease BN (tRNA processing enzyme)
MDASAEMCTEFSSAEQCLDGQGSIGLALLMPSYFFTFEKISNNMTEQQDPNQLNIEISEEMAEGQYANLAIITHSHAEFVLDFVNVMPGTPKSKVKSRIILTPQHAKRLMKALADNIQKFEAANGLIKDLEEIQIPMQFGGPAAQA